MFNLKGLILILSVTISVNLFAQEYEKQLSSAAEQYKLYECDPKTDKELKKECEYAYNRFYWAVAQDMKDCSETEYVQQRKNEFKTCVDTFLLRPVSEDDKLAFLNKIIDYMDSKLNPLIKIKEKTHFAIAGMGTLTPVYFYVDDIQMKLSRKISDAKQ